MRLYTHTHTHTHGYNIKDKKGITLIALIVTIIVLIILAGVSINMITGDDGIISRAASAKEKTAVEEVKEQIKLEVAELRTDNLGEVSNSEIEEVVEKYDKDGKIKTDDDGNQYIETEKGYKVIVSDVFAGKTEVSTFKMCMFEGKTYNNLPTLYTSEEIVLTTLENKGNQIYGVAKMEDGSEESGYLDIITGEYEFDYVDASSLLEEDTLVPAVLINSDYEVCDLEEDLKSDDYLLIIITDESQLATLQSGNYYTETNFWVLDYYKKPTVYVTDIMDKYGFYADVAIYQINDGDTSYEVTLEDENFEETKALVEELKARDESKITETDYYNWNLKVDNYDITVVYAMFYEGCIANLQDSNYEYYYEPFLNGPTLIFDFATTGLPCAYIEYKDEYKEEGKVANYSEVLEKAQTLTGDELEEELAKYEYYDERKYYMFSKGKQIIF